jgi:hypothetical protein
VRQPVVFSKAAMGILAGEKYHYMVSDLTSVPSTRM